MVARGLPVAQVSPMSLQLARERRALIVGLSWRACHPGSSILWDRRSLMGPPGPLCLRLLGLLTSASGEARDRIRPGASTGAAKMLEPRNPGLYSSGRS